MFKQKELRTKYTHMCIINIGGNINKHIFYIISTPRDKYKYIKKYISQKNKPTHTKYLPLKKFAFFFVFYIFYVVVFSSVLNFLFLGMFLFSSNVFLFSKIVIFMKFLHSFQLQLTITIANQQRNIKHTLLYNMFSLFFFLFCF